MEDETRSAISIVENESLLDAYQCIIYELREGILPALAAIRIIIQKEREVKNTDELLSLIETRLEFSKDTINALMIEIFLKRLRREINDGNPHSEDV